MNSALSSVCVPDLVYGSSVVERLQSLVYVCDSSIFFEAWSHHGQRSQQPEFYSKDLKWDSNKRGWDAFSMLSYMQYNSWF